VAKDFFLDHPTVDKVFRVVLALARETYVLRDRLALVETLLDEKGVVTRTDFESHQPGEAELENMNQAAHAFIASILQPIAQERIAGDPEGEDSG